MENLEEKAKLSIKRMILYSALVPGGALYSTWKLDNGKEDPTVYKNARGVPTQFTRADQYMNAAIPDLAKVYIYYELINHFLR